MSDQNEIFGTSLRCVHGKFAFEFHKIRMGDDVIQVFFFKQLSIISISIEPTNFILKVNVCCLDLKWPEVAGS